MSLTPEQISMPDEASAHRVSRHLREAFAEYPRLGWQARGQVFLDIFGACSQDELNAAMAISDNIRNGRIPKQEKEKL